MKKRILSILLLCCMVLTLLPTTVLAADGPMDTIPKYDVSIDVYNRTSDISIKDSNKEAFTQCIAFESSFRSPKKGGGAWEANEEYTWSWWLARSEGGEWNLMTWGY